MSDDVSKGDPPTLEDYHEQQDSTALRAEVRHATDFTGETESYLVLISEGKVWPYLHIPEALPDRVLEAALEKLNAP